MDEDVAMPAVAPPPSRRPLTRAATDFDAATLVGRKGGRRITLCLPARDEEGTIGAIVSTIRRELCEASPLVDEILVVDDGSVDATAVTARVAGARVVSSGGRGKGHAMYEGLLAAEADVVAYCDADVRPFRAAFVVGLLGPLLAGDAIGFVKGFYDRPLDGRTGEGGRVTELVAKPLLRTLFPALAGFAQPLAGECAALRAVLEQVPFVGGYGVDIGLLIDVAERFGVSTMTQVDLGRRDHRNRPLAELGVQAEEVLRTALARAGLGEAVDERPSLATCPPENRLTA